MKKLILKLFTLFFILSIPFVSASTISATNHSTYQLGDSNTKIYELKINLVKLGFADWNITDTSSIFDSATEEAVIEFQNYFEIEVTGKADEATFGKIKDVLSSPMQIGNSNVEIQEMKRNLTRLGFSNWNILNISPVFGAGTEEAVRNFQRYYGLIENGITDEVTLRKIEELLETPMKTGDRSFAVQKMKRDLTRIGFTTWNINNISTTFGAGTERAVKDFQKYYGLPVTGVVDRVSRQKIEDILFSPMQNGNSSIAIQELKRDIVRLGFASWNINNVSPVFGVGTDATVRAVQSYYGLVVNGIADEVTLRKIEEILSSPMQSGNSSEEIRELKRNLSRVGITNWNIDHVSPTFGAGTEDAVRSSTDHY
ncbi:MAG: peptidoglycan-binding protein, partial [Bacillus sp. (in: Bacteria)]|nr:peptidoglycan-binding protein [Bacillus sp. (in: firmicutes)]